SPGDFRYLRSVSQFAIGVYSLAAFTCSATRLAILQTTTPSRPGAPASLSEHFNSTPPFRPKNAYGLLRSRMRRLDGARARSLVDSLGGGIRLFACGRCGVA